MKPSQTSKSLLVALGLGLCGSAQAATGVGPYYAIPAWDQTLPASTRFLVLTNMNSEAVLDRETGLVWEKEPSTSQFNWFSASTHCLIANKGGRTGWRLPALPELMSLVDRSQPNPALPSGHPFTAQSSFYWSATTSASNPANAWGAIFFAGNNLDGRDKSGNSGLAWCVRGGPGVDAQ